MPGGRARARAMRRRRRRRPPTPAAARHGREPAHADGRRRRPRRLPAAGPGLAVGMTEFNPNLVAARPRSRCRRRGSGVRDALGRDPARVLPARDRLEARSSRRPSSPPNLDKRRRPAACATSGRAWSWVGVREQLRALASRQREGGWQTLVVLTGTPDWAAAPRRAGASARRRTPRARPPRADALAAPTASSSLDVLGGRRARRARRCASGARGTSRTCRRSSARSARECDAASPSLAPARLHRARAHDDRRARRGARRPAAGDRRDRGPAEVDTKLVTSVARVHRRACPQDIVCASTVYTQHAYIGGDDPVDARPRPRSPRAAARSRTRSGSPRPASARRRRSTPRVADPDGRGLPRPARPARPVVQRPARDRRLPVHGARGRQVPDRPVLHRPDRRPARRSPSGPPGAEGAPPTAPPPRRPRGLPS